MSKPSGKYVPSLEFSILNFMRMCVWRRPSLTGLPRWGARRDRMAQASWKILERNSPFSPVKHNTYGASGSCVACGNLLNRLFASASFKSIDILSFQGGNDFWYRSIVLHMLWILVRVCLVVHVVSNDIRARTSLLCVCDNTHAAFWNALNQYA